MPLRIERVNLSSENQIVALSNNLSVIVGPNNVGKSALLSHISRKLGEQPGNAPEHNPIVTSLDVIKPTMEEVEKRLTAIHAVRPPGQYPQGSFNEPSYLTRQGGTLFQSQLSNILNQQAGSVGSLAQVFISHLAPEGRLGQLGNTTPPDLYNNPQGSTPLQLMYENRDLENRIADLTVRAFGEPVTVNRHGGNQIGLHMGRPSAPEPPLGVKTEYQRQIMALPLAADQGHGVQAFVGMLLVLATQQYDVILVDEPEAFLHPPQARLLGELFVEFSKSGSQVIVATHSDDFLQGVVGSAGLAADVTVARLTRPERTTNAVAQVPPPAIRKLYEDPLLRFSNILAGIFYRGVVLCESESDCRYYEAVLGYVISIEDGRSHPDLLFTQCGGKDRFAKAVTALAGTRVPTAVIADIDLLADPSKFRETLEALGGDYQQIESDVTVLTSHVNQKTIEPDATLARVKIIQVLDSLTGSTVSNTQANAIRQAIARVSGWKHVKANGRTAISSGNPTMAFDRILAACQSVGLFLVPVGELERFHPEISNANKQSWLREVFETSVYKSSHTSQQFVEAVAGYIAATQRQ